MRVVLLLPLLAAVAALAAAHQDARHDAPVPNVHEVRAARARSLHNFEVVGAGGVRALHLTAKRTVLRRHGLPQPFPDKLQVQLDAFDTTVYFDLEINEHLLHPQARTRHFDAGRVVDDSAVEHRYYRGTARSSLGEGWARITVHETADGDALITGGFAQNGDMYYIKTPQHFNQMTARISERAKYAKKRALEDDVRMVVYRSSDIEVHDPGAHVCGVTDEHVQAFNSDFPRPLDNFNASDLASVVHGVHKRLPTGCSSSLRVLYMGVELDGNYVINYGTVDNARAQALTDWNLANEAYQAQFNIILGVRSLNTQATANGSPAWNVQCTSGPTITQRLSLFSQWRGSQSQDSGLYHLLSTCATLPTIGIAWLNQLCQSTAFSQTAGDGSTQYVSGTAVSTVVDEEWLVVAHETGHNFGSVHDCTSSTCPATGNPPSCNACQPCNCNGQYIMNPSEAGGATAFSPTSQAQVCQRSSATGTCLEPPGGATILNTGICGNGIKEGNEQCDCGGTESCDINLCCFTNCTLKPGAACNNDTNTPCCRNCQVDGDTTKVCRAAVDPQCDLPETCNGVDFTCPPDNYTANGTPCMGNVSFPTTLRCASGVCTSRQLQCYQRALATGNSDGYTQDCGPFSGSCQMFCSSPIESCTFFYSIFLDGTPCGSGECIGGQCTVPNLIETIISFIKANVVMVAIGAAMVGILIFGFLVWGCQSAGRKQVDTRYGRMTRMQALQRSMTFQRGHPGQRPSNTPIVQGGRSSQASSKPPSRNSPRPSSDYRASGPTATPPPYEPPSYELAPVPVQPRTSSDGRANNMLTPANDGGAASAGLSTSPGRVRCPICNSTFASEALLNTHIDIDHN